MSIKLEGHIYKFQVGNNARHYSVVTLPFNEARKVFKADRYHSETGKGEQREIFPAHCKKLQKEMREGNYTPTAVTVGLSYIQREKIGKNPATFKLQFEDNQYLSLLDGGHRIEAIEKIYNDGDDDVKKQLDNLPITAIVVLDGSTKKDFLNLQLGRQVDRSHMLSLSVQEHMTDKKNSEFFELAFSVAKIVNDNKDSPFYNQIRFDTRGIGGLPISSLSSKGASDIGTSLIGAAKVLKLANRLESAKWYSDLLVKTYAVVKQYAEDLTARGSVLCPPPNGTKGGATMYIGLATLLAYRLHIQDRTEPSAQDLQALIHSVNKTMAKPVAGNFSGPAKRAMLGEYAESFFADLNLDTLHYGVPTELVETLSASTFAVEKLTKEKGKRGRKKKEAEPTTTTEEPAFDEPEVRGKASNAVVIDEASSFKNPKAKVIEELPDGTPVTEAEASTWNPEEELQA